MRYAATQPPHARRSAKRLARTVATLTMGALALPLLALTLSEPWTPQARAQEIDPALAEAYDSPEMNRVLAIAREMPVADLLDVVKRLEQMAAKRLLRVRPTDIIGFEHFAEQGATQRQSGVARVLERDRYGRERFMPGGGCYYSFTDRSNDYNKHPELQFYRGKFSAGFNGGQSGLVRRLAATDLRAVTEADLPQSFLGPADTFHALSRERNPETGELAAEVGALYVARTIHWEEVDSVSVFTVTAIDDDGVTIAWRRLKVLPRPGKRNRARATAGGQPR